MRNDDTIKRELADAQADLEHQISNVRHAVDDVVARVHKPIDIIAEHEVVAIVTALGLGLLVGWIRSRA